MPSKGGKVKHYQLVTTTIQVFYFSQQQEYNVQCNDTLLHCKEWILKCESPECCAVAGQAVFSNINTTPAMVGRSTINKLSTSTQICSSANPKHSRGLTGGQICSLDPVPAFSYQILAPMQPCPLIGRLARSRLSLVEFCLQSYFNVYHSIPIPACLGHITSHTYRTKLHSSWAPWTMLEPICTNFSFIIRLSLIHCCVPIAAVIDDFKQGRLHEAEKCLVDDFKMGHRS